MKYFAIALVASVLDSALCASIEDRAQSGDRVLDLVNAAFTYVASQSGKDYAIKLPNLDHKHEVKSSPPIDVVVSLQNGRILGAFNLELNNVQTDADALTAKLSFVHPQVEFVADNYEIVGTALERKISGNGAISVKAVNMSNSYTIQLAEDPSTKALSISSLSDQFDLGGVEVNLGNIQVEGMTKAEVENFIEKETIKRLRELEVIVQTLERIEINYLNRMMGGMTMEEVTQWLKDNTHSSLSAALSKALALAM